MKPLFWVFKTKDEPSPRLRRNIAASFMPEPLKILPRAFYDRDPAAVARELLGKVLVRRGRRMLLQGRIVEV